MNKMSVAHLWYNADVLQADTQQTVTGKALEADSAGFRALANVACLCSKAIFKPGDELLPVPLRLGLKCFLELVVFKAEFLLVEGLTGMQVRQQFCDTWNK